MSNHKTKPALLIGASLLTAVLGGCTATEKTSAEKAQEIVSRLTYVKDSRGLCYATIGSYAYGGNIVVSITAVPCKQVGL